MYLLYCEDFQCDLKNEPFGLYTTEKEAVQDGNKVANLPTFPFDTLKLFEVVGRGQSKLIGIWQWDVAGYYSFKSYKKELVKCL